MIGVEVPLVEVTLVEGRTPQQLRALVHELHTAVVKAIGAPPQNVRVIIREVPSTHWAAGDVTIAERAAATSGRDAVAD
jgi:4-oxalocrotonate tautomerase